MEVVTQAGIDFELSRLWRIDTWEESRDLERKLKHWHSDVKLCPLCQGKPPDPLVYMRQGHWPLALHDGSGKRQPMGTHIPTFVRRVVD